MALLDATLFNGHQLKNDSYFKEKSTRDDDELNLIRKRFVDLHQFDDVDEIQERFEKLKRERQNNNDNDDNNNNNNNNVENFNRTNIYDINNGFNDDNVDDDNDVQPMNNPKNSFLIEIDELKAFRCKNCGFRPSHRMKRV